MGFFGRLLELIDRPADQSVLQGDRRRGSEAIIREETTETKQAAASGVRRDRRRRTQRWRRF